MTDGKANEQAPERVRCTYDVITLTGEDSRAFAEALVAPPAPNEHLRNLAERYKRTTQT